MIFISFHAEYAVFQCKSQSIKSWLYRCVTGLVSLVLCNKGSETIDFVKQVYKDQISTVNIREQRWCFEPVSYTHLTLPTKLEV